MKKNYIIVFAFIFLSPLVRADQFCFATADSYYEQVYCQLQAKAQTKTLPSFNQFKKNSEQVQYSLLKRPAERNAIKLPAPTKKILTQKSSISAQDVTEPKSNTAVSATNQTFSPGLRVDFRPQGHATTLDTATCELLGNQLMCSGSAFTLIGNKANHRLVKTALLDTNKMALPSYHGGALNQYLAKAYQQYIAKMLEIGLGGVTMTYGKFAYLYQDLHSKGLDFAQRFETMYGFLKKDKSSMGVSEAVSVPQGLGASHCTPLGERLYVCDLQGRNYIFELQ